MTTSEERIERKRQALFDSDERCCFIERERLLGKFEAIAEQHAPERRNAAAFAWLLDGLSTPIAPEDILLGRMLEALPVPESEFPKTFKWTDFFSTRILWSPGHQTVNYAAVIVKGFDAIAREAAANAARLGTRKASYFADNARVCTDAIGRFARRYAAAARAAAAGEIDPARQAQLERAASALETVPAAPAGDFFSAVQSCYLTHLIYSCALGGRDYCFGRMDQYLYSFYRRDIEHGALTREDALEILTDLHLNANLISGKARGNCDLCSVDKPVPSQGSKQYIVLGGVDEAGTDMSNELSHLFLEAALRVRMKEPVLHVRVHPHVPSPLKRAAVAAAVRLQGQVQFSNDKFVPGALIHAGVDPVDAWNYTASGCSRTDAGTNCNKEFFCFPIHWLMALLEDGSAYPAFDDLLEAFRKRVDAEMAGLMVRNTLQAEPYWDYGFINGGGIHFHPESLIVDDCVARCLNTCEGGPRYHYHTLHVAGIATLVNSLMSIRALVYEQRVLGLDELLRILRADFAGHETLRQMIQTNVPKFGNDNEAVDTLAAQVGRFFADAVDHGPRPMGNTYMVSFYSLNTAAKVGKKTGATPDGRHAGEPISENQSPAYGTDLKGATALLKSVARLPFEKAGSGSLNLKLMRNTPPDKLVHLIDAYFAMGGSILGPCFVDAAEMKDARVHPERHRSLQVRMHGFSEYFTSLPDDEQVEMINRTAQR